MIEWFARNSVAANLLMWLIIMGGAIAFFTQLQVETFPSGESDSISIQVALRGSTPEDIELGVAVRIEEAVQDLEGIKEMVSLSREGSTTIRLEVDSGYDDGTQVLFWHFICEPESLTGVLQGCRSALVA